MASASSKYVFILLLVLSATSIAGLRLYSKRAAPILVPTVGINNHDTAASARGPNFKNGDAKADSKSDDNDKEKSDHGGPVPAPKAPVDYSKLLNETPPEAFTQLDKVCVNWIAARLLYLSAMTESPPGFIRAPLAA